MPDRHRAARYRDRRQEWTKDHQRALAQNQADPPGDDERAKFPPVETPDNCPLEHSAEQTDDEKGENGAQPERHPAMPRKAGGVSSHHHEFAMGEIDNVHHAEDDDQAQGGKQKERAIGGELVEDADNRREAVHSRSSNLLALMQSGPGVRMKPDPSATPCALLAL